MIVSHGAGQERRVLLADANPAIGALPVATLEPLAEPAGALGPARPMTAAASAPGPGHTAGAAGVPAGHGRAGRRVNGPVTPGRTDAPRRTPVNG